MKAIGYIRFSTKKQEEGSSIERQQEEINRYCQEKGLDLVATFIDDGFSGDGEHMAKGKLGTVIFPAIEAGKYQGFALVVEKMDRFSRQDSDEVVVNQLRLRRGGVELHLAHDGRKATRKDLGEKVQDLVDSEAASVFLKNHKINIRKGKESKKDLAEHDGWILSRSVPVWLQVVGRENIGNKITNPGKIEVIPEMVAVVQEAYRMASLGMGRTMIFEKLNGRLNGLSMSWLTRVLSDRSVLGYFKPAGRDEIPGYFPPIIDQQLFDEVRRQAQSKRRNGKSAGGNRKHSDRADNLLQGLVFDGNRPMYYQPVLRNRYLASAITGDRKVNRIQYAKVAEKVVDILEREDWLAIRGMSESVEFLAAKGELNAVLSQLDVIARQIKTDNLAIEQEDDVATVRVIARKIARNEELMESLQSRKEGLQAHLDAEMKRSAALYQDEELKSLIREVKATPDMRMRLRSEIQRRVSRIELKFNPTQIDGIIRYVNGAERNFTIE